MKENSQLLKFSIISAVISLLIIFVTFKLENKNFLLICNIFQNIFAGLIVLIGTSWISYNRLKRLTLESIMSYCFRFMNVFGKIEHIDEEEYIDYECFNKNLEECDENYSNYTEKEIKGIYKKYVHNFVNKDKKKLEKIMKKYINILNIDLTEFWNLYEELDFFINKKYKIEIYNEFFKYIDDLMNQIKLKIYHFNIYFESNRGNIIINRHFIQDLQKEFFCKTSAEKQVEYKDIPHVEYLCSGEIYYNKVYKHLSNQFKKLQNITYRKSKNKRL